MSISTRTHAPVCDGCGSASGLTAVEARGDATALEDWWLMNSAAGFSRFDGALHFCSACFERFDIDGLLVLCALQRGDA